MFQDKESTVNKITKWGRTCVWFRSCNEFFISYLQDVFFGFEVLAN